MQQIDLNKNQFDTRAVTRVRRSELAHNTCRGGTGDSGEHALGAAWLDGVRTVGVTSGASVPELLVRDVLEGLG